MNQTTPTAASQPIALTMGDPAGVGGELTLKAWVARANNVPPFFAIDNAERLAAIADSLSLSVPLKKITSPAEATDCFADALPVMDIPLGAAPVPGILDAANAGAVQNSIETAVTLVTQGDASAVVTNPIHKETLYQAGFRFPGHTEYLADLAGIETPPVMMLASPRLRVVPVTIHISLADALAKISGPLIIEIASITAADLKRSFGITNPRLAIAGVNPHAGEGGAMGVEESLIIEPAVDELRALGIDAFGPVPPDTLFTDAARQTYDAVICMYHDQALIPIKTLDFDSAVNVTLGLPFIRTSPDHGTALDIAGSGTARETSLIAALEMAAAMAGHRNPASTA